MIIARPFTFSGMVVLVVGCLLASSGSAAGAGWGVDRGTIVINKASIDALVDAGLLAPKLKNEAWNVLRDAAVAPAATSDAATSDAATSTSASDSRRAAAVGGSGSGPRRIEVTIEEMGNETSALSELSQLLSMSNLLYSIGSVILVIVFGFFVMILHRGASKCAVIAAFAAIFYHLGLALLQKPHSELIGGLMYTVPAFAAPAAMLGLLVEVDVVSAEDVRSMVADIKNRPRAALETRRSHHPRVHRACLILECTTVLVAARLYLDHPFPGLLAPMFGGAYLALVSAMLLIQGVPFHHMGRAITLSDFSLFIVSVIFACVLMFAGVGGALAVLPSWLRTYAERLLGLFPAHARMVLSTDIVTDLLPEALQGVVSDVRFACLVTACNTAVVNVPISLVSVAWVGSWRWGESGGFEIADTDGHGKGMAALFEF